MEKSIRAAVAILLAVAVFWPAVASADQFFPDAQVEVVLPEAHKEYLGLADDAASFRLSDIKAEFLLIEVYSLYCSPCQRDAPDMNALYDKVAEAGLSDRLKFIGLAAGNTEREVEFWRDRFHVEFPLIPDEEYVLHQLLGGVGTPFYVLARVEGPDALRILFAREGAFDNKDDFFASILAHVGMDVR